MIISQSSVGMSAKSTEKRTYRQTSGTLMQNLSTGAMNFSENSFSASYEKSMEEHIEDGTDDHSSPKQVLKSEPYSNTLPSAVKVREDDRENLLLQLRIFMIEFRHSLSLMIGARDKAMRHKLLSGNQLDLTSGAFGGNYNYWRRTDYYSIEYEESAGMSFETTGKVKTADGRELDFNLELSMSRDYCESIDIVNQGIEAIMTDPLVISLDGSPISVSDQKWSFDIDGDGTKDSISLLSKGAGFLCYDKDGDGKIGDGSEMFGSKTGNGFAELSEYDTDGNGWIDEADEIYDKLSVWQKDDAGNDKLINLRDAKLGAIYLGSARSEFALKSIEDNLHNAQIRRSGVFLHENGTAGLIQQIDMAKGFTKAAV